MIVSKKLEPALLQDLSQAVDDLFCEFKTQEEREQDEITRPVSLPERFYSARHANQE